MTPLRSIASVAILIMAWSLSASAQGVAEYQQQFEPKPAANEPDATESAPAPAQITVQPTTSIRVPAPTITTQPNFKNASGYGLTTDTDGSPLTDHRIYATDTYYFAKKVRIGMAKLGENADLKKLLEDLDKAMNQYGSGEATINYEEKIRVCDRISLDDNSSPRGTEVRGQMKQAIVQMDELRSKITSQFGTYLDAGRLPEEK